MFNFHSMLRLLALLLIPLVLTACKTPWSPSSSSDSPGRSAGGNPLDNVNVLFDWNKQKDALICSAIEANNNLLSIGVVFSPTNVQENTTALNALESYIEDVFSGSVAVVGRENRLSILNVEMIDCSALASIRSLPNVEFVEAKYVAPISEADLFENALELQTQSTITKAVQLSDDPDNDSPDEEVINPGFYDPEVSDLTYVEYIRQIEEKAADRIVQHGMNRI